MKDKMKQEKTTLMPSVDGVKTEPNLDVEFKKEATPLCENESKNSNICSKVIVCVFLIEAFSSYLVNLMWDLEGFYHFPFHCNNFVEAQILNNVFKKNVLILRLPIVFIV